LQTESTEYTDAIHMTSAEPPIQWRGGDDQRKDPIQGRGGDDQRKDPIQGRGGMTSAKTRYKGGVLDWAHTCNYNSVAFVIAHAWYAPTYFSTFSSVAAEFILRVYSIALHPGLCACNWHCVGVSGYCARNSRDALVFRL
jgi:hypothetical protein